MASVYEEKGGVRRSLVFGVDIVRNGIDSWPDGVNGSLTWSLSVSASHDLRSIDLGHGRTRKISRPGRWRHTHSLDVVQPIFDL